ncbi:hypothetical protein CYMTET_7716 [Cymbomonas tetramitiformis]|uniref:Uncharacterized protein n=1 Tax=Cymbomonas tetramitiformis TaxID=36881 RepID=A0AAE0GUZ1_9CHLO|nr:hypothetical protein CYMTET_7716 [Cymbomonas tetramitiformis]
MGLPSDSLPLGPSRAPTDKSLETFNNAVHPDWLAPESPPPSIIPERVGFSAVGGPLAGGVAEPATRKRLPPPCTFDSVLPDLIHVEPDPVDLCESDAEHSSDSEDDGTGLYPPEDCLPVNDGGAPPAAATFRRFGVPRTDISLFRQFALSSFLITAFLFSAAAVPTLGVGGGVRGLVVPGATYGYGCEHPDVALLSSPYPPGVAADSPLPPRDVRSYFSHSDSAAFIFEFHSSVPPWDPPDPLGSGGAVSDSASLNSNILTFPPYPLGSGGVKSPAISSQFASDTFLAWDPTAELGSADQLIGG